MTPIASRTRPGSRATSKPATNPWPEVGTISVVNIRLSVVLPAPLGPSRPNSSPRRTSKLTWSTAVKAPKRLVSSRACIAADCDSIVARKCDLDGHSRFHLSGRLQNPHLDVKGADVLAPAANVGLGRELALLSDRHHLPRKKQRRMRRECDLRGTADADRAKVSLLDIHARPDGREIVDGQDRRPRRDPFADLEILAHHGAGDWGADDRVVRLVGIVLDVGSGGGDRTAVAVERGARVVAFLGRDHVLQVQPVVARHRELRVVQIGAGVREIAPRLGELVFDVAMSGGAADLAALSRIALEQVELHDTAGDAAGDGELGRSGYDR